MEKRMQIALNAKIKLAGVGLSIGEGKEDNSDADRLNMLVSEPFLFQVRHFTMNAIVWTNLACPGSTSQIEQVGGI
jgi:hypothetical protein